MNYKEEARDFHKQVNMRLSMTDEQWLRAHDARLLREEADRFTEDDGDFRWHQVSDWLESRAREIEIGEKP